MSTERVNNFVSALIDMTAKGLLTWERFPQHYPFQNNFFIQNFIEKDLNPTQSHSYFFSHKTGLVIFVHHTPSDTNELYIQTHFGEPIINLTSKCRKFNLHLLERAISHFNESVKSLPDSIYNFMSDIEKLNNSPKCSHDRKVDNDIPTKSSVPSNNLSPSVSPEGKTFERLPHLDRIKALTRPSVKFRLSGSDPNSSLNNTLEELSLCTQKPRKEK